MIKRWGGCIILALFLIETCGYYPLFFKMMQWHIREQMEHTLSRKLPADQLMLITLNAQQAQNADWDRGGNEIVFEGRRFDVARKIDSAGTLYVYCLEDKKESALFANLNELVKEQMDSKSREPNRSEQALMRLFSSLHFRYSSYLFLSCHVQHFTLHIAFPDYSSEGFQSVLTPPPDSLT